MNIHAFTETGSSNPGFISINADDHNDGRLAITLRARGNQASAFVNMTRDQLAQMHSDIGAYLLKTAHAQVIEETKPSKFKGAPKDEV